MEPLRQTNIYKLNRLYKDMPMRTVTGEFFGGRVHCAEPETKPEQEPSFLLTRPEKKYRPKKSVSKIQQQKILSQLVKKQQRLTRKQRQQLEREERLKRERLKRERLKRERLKRERLKRERIKRERLKRERLKRERLNERTNQFLDFLRGERLPAKIGDLHKSFHKIVNYRTFQRRIQVIHEQGRITIKKVIGGKAGCTTLILKVNKVRQDAR